VPAPDDYVDGEIGGMMIGRGNRSTRRKPAPVPLCPPQTPHACLHANPGRRGGKSATNRLSYGTTKICSNFKVFENVKLFKILLSLNVKLYVIFVFLSHIAGCPSPRVLCYITL
jgi:hypothetical protein